MVVNVYIYVMKDIYIHDIHDHQRERVYIHDDWYVREVYQTMLREVIILHHLQLHDSTIVQIL